MRRNRAGGQALVEFALVFPILILMLIVLFDLGRAVFIYTSLTNGAREGARLAAVNQDKPLVIQRAEEQTAATSPTVTVDFYLPPTSTTADPSTAGSCGTFDSSGNVVAPPGVGCVAVVQVTANYSPLTPIVSNLIGPFTLSGSSVSTIEFSCPDPTRTGFPYPTADLCPRQP